jgi:hypothetical protein
MSTQNSHEESVNRRDDEFAVLDQLFTVETTNKWAIGDEINRLVRAGHKVKEIAKRYGREPNTLSETRRTCLKVLEAERDYSVPRSSTTNWRGSPPRSSAWTSTRRGELSPRRS